MKIIVREIFIMVIVLAAGGLTMFAQNAAIASAAGDKYVISARAGGVNYSEDAVGIIRKHGLSGILLKGDTVEIGDRVSTGPNGRAEILLNPGSYLRIGGNTAFEFKSTSLDDLRLKVHRGSATLEVFAGDDFVINLDAPRAKFKLINSGVFRLDVAADGSGNLAVWKGRAQVGSTNARIVKAGQSINVDGSSVSIAKFDRDPGDTLFSWSRERAKEISKLSRSLRKRDVRELLQTSYAGGQWNAYGSFGLWVSNRFTGANCFLPFGYGWSSPYGYGFGQNVWWYDGPWTNPQIHTYTPPASPSGTPGPAPGLTKILSAGDRSPLPPFIRMNGGSGGGDFGRGRDDSVFETRGSSNDYSPAPVYSPPPASAPPAARQDPGTGSKP